MVPRDLMKKKTSQTSFTYNYYLPLTLSKKYSKVLEVLEFEILFPEF